MPAVQETVDRVRRIDVDQYKYGFVTDIESDKAPKGLSEDIVRFISAKKNEPDWMLEWRLEAYRRWLTMDEPTWARVDYPPIDYQDIYYYSAPKSKAGRSRSTRSIRSCCAPTRSSAFRCASARCCWRPKPARGGRDGARGERAMPRRGRRGVRFRLGRHHLQGRAGEGRRASSARSRRRSASIPSS